MVSVGEVTWSLQEVTFLYTGRHMVSVLEVVWVLYRKSHGPCTGSHMISTGSHVDLYRKSHDYGIQIKTLENYICFK